MLANLKDSTLAPIKTWRQLLRAAAHTLSQCSDVANPQLEARRIISHVFQISDIDVMMQGVEPLLPSQASLLPELHAIVQERLGHKPLSKILGFRTFWHDTFYVTEDTLDPRPETEGVIEHACALFQNSLPQHILDLGTGTGCILLSLLREFPEAHGVGVDISSRALDVARINTQRLGLEKRARFLEGTWFQPLRDNTLFNLVVSNPPYISHGEIASLAPSVQLFDPLEALDGGKDGLEAYRTLAKGLKNCLRRGGWFVFEIGYNQGSEVLKLFQNFQPHLAQDLGGHDRYIIGQKT
jgi:release factor glutamine methyltransferase